MLCCTLLAGLTNVCLACMSKINMIKFILLVPMNRLKRIENILVFALSSSSFIGSPIFVLQQRASHHQHCFIRYGTVIFMLDDT